MAVAVLSSSFMAKPQAAYSVQEKQRPSVTINTTAMNH
jgi:hypothetical protein